MNESKQLPTSGSDFKKMYFLKEELLEMCKEHKLPTSGSKDDLITYIANFIDGLSVTKKKNESKKTEITKREFQGIIRMKEMI